MSVVGDLFAEMAQPLLLEQLGRQTGDANAITHYPAGVVASGAAIAAIVALDDEPDQGTSDDEHGSRRMRRGQLQVATSVTITVSERPEDRDTFLVDDELWTAYELIAGPGEGGLQTVLIAREEPISTKRTRVR